MSCSTGCCGGSCGSGGAQGAQGAQGPEEENKGLLGRLIDNLR